MNSSQVLAKLVKLTNQRACSNLVHSFRNILLFESYAHALSLLTLAPSTSPVFFSVPMYSATPKRAKTLKKAVNQYPHIYLFCTRAFFIIISDDFKCLYNKDLTPTYQAIKHKINVTNLFIRS